MKVAQQFTAGITSDDIAVRRADDRGYSFRILGSFHSSVSRTTLRIVHLPSDKSLGYLHSSANADWERSSFLCKALLPYCLRLPVAGQDHSWRLIRENAAKISMAETNEHNLTYQKHNRRLQGANRWLNRQ